MNDLTNEIYKLFGLPNNMIYPISNRNSNVCSYLVKDLLTYGVAVENINDVEINEKFNNIFIRNVNFTIEDTIKSVIYLYTNIENNIEDFIFIAESFLNKRNEKVILIDPIKWVNNWKNMLGDSIKKKKTYDVLGELFVLKTILPSYPNSHWQASKKGVHDIEDENVSFEVKSSTLRDKTVVSISSAFQLSSEKEEFLYYCRFEEDENGIYSIDSVVDEVIDLGYDYYAIEEELYMLGYPKGAITRKKKYNILEVRKYVVNEENFPIISLQDINGFAPKDNIIGFELKLDLAGIEYDKIV